MANPINLNELPLQQLQAVKQQMEEVCFIFAPIMNPARPSLICIRYQLQTKHSFSQELRHLTGSYAQLKQAQAKFNDCVDSLDSINGQSAGILGPTQY